MMLFRSRAFWGAALILAGGLLLLQSLDVLPGAAILWPVLFATAGAGFLYAFFRDPDSWWAAIPGFTLLGLTAAAAWDGLGPGTDELGGAMFLGGMGLGFVATYLARRENWWAVIPGGALLTLALVSGLSASLGQAAEGVVLFLGLAVTFGLLAVLPTPEGRMRWPIIPAAVLATIGVLVSAGATTVLDLVWPVALILAGLYLVFRAFGPGGGPGRHA